MIIGLIHCVIVAAPWIIAIGARKPWLLLVAVALEVAAMVQWVVFGHCLLNPLETGRSTSAGSEFVARMMGLPTADFDKGFVLIQCVAPMFVQLSRIAAALGI